MIDMLESEKRAIKIHLIKAPEEYLNSHEYDLMREEPSRFTSSYFLLNNYKDSLIDEVYQKGE